MIGQAAPTRFIELIGSDRSGWDASLGELSHDIYHTSAYHQCSGLGSSGESWLYVYREADRKFAWPYILRDLSTLPGCEDCGYCDVTSGYGYSGPVASEQAADGDFLNRAWKGLVETWRSQRVISAFTRFHPLLGNHRLLETNAESAAQAGSEILECGATVALDLRIPIEQQVRRYRKTLRQDIRKIREAGFRTYHDTGWANAEAFVDIYNSTMSRLSAARSYLIDPEWLEQMRLALGDRLQLLATEYEGRIASVLLAMEYRGFVHAHLTGTHEDFQRASPLKLLLDDTRQWAAERGNQFFHIGGGVGGSRDSLFQFKASYSPDVYPFKIGRWILDRAAYAEAVESRRSYFAGLGSDLGSPEFFPAYRFEPQADPGSGAPSNDTEKSKVEEYEVLA